MGARGGGGGRTGGGGAAGRNDFAREAVTHPLIASINQKNLNLALASIDANIKDPKLRAEMKAMVERMHKEMGGLPSGVTFRIGGNNDVPASGRPAVWLGVNQGGTITLNRKYFGKGYDYAERVGTARIKQGTGFSNNKPALMTPAHEIGHGYYSRLSSAGKAQVASIHAAFKSSSAGARKGWGTHSSSSPAEFYADAVAKSILGGSDKWTKALGKIR